jgi:hypothetical protein
VAERKDADMSSQKSLADYVAKAPVRERVVADCAALVDEEVKSKGGLSGVAIKGAYGTVKTIKPRFVPDVIDALFDDWVARLEPYYARWRASGSGSLAEYLTARSDEVAEDLLKVTDERSAHSKHKTATKLYGRMRPSAKRNVSAAIPKLGGVMERHIKEADGAAQAT